MAKAIWEQSRKQEIERTASFNYPSGLIQTAASLLKDAEPLLSLITGWALISKSFDLSLRYHLCHSTKSDLNNFLQGVGPLAPDSARVRLARLLGWLSDETYSVVNFMRTKRNLVAHSIIRTDEVDYPGSMPKPAKTKLDATLDRMLNALPETERSRFVNAEHGHKIYFLVTASNVLSEVVFGPSLLRLGVPKGSPFFKFDEGPEWWRTVQRDVARGALTIIGIDESENN
ncbi:MAG: hypothetical protein PVI23_16770 [Maricaulaceae bacterium]